MFFKELMAVWHSFAINGKLVQNTDFVETSNHVEKLIFHYGNEDDYRKLQKLIMSEVCYYHARQVFC